MSTHMSKHMTARQTRVHACLCTGLYTCLYACLYTVYAHGGMNLRAPRASFGLGFACAHVSTHVYAHVCTHRAVLASPGSGRRRDRRHWRRELRHDVAELYDHRLRRHRGRRRWLRRGSALPNRPATRRRVLPLALTSRVYGKRAWRRHHPCAACSNALPVPHSRCALACHSRVPSEGPVPSQASPDARIRHPTKGCRCTGQPDKGLLTGARGAYRRGDVVNQPVGPHWFGAGISAVAHRLTTDRTGSTVGGRV